MQGLERNRSAWPNRWLESPRRGSTIVAFQPLGAASPRSSFRKAAVAAAHSPADGAEIIRFQPRRTALAAQSRTAQAKPAATGLQHSTEGHDDYRHRMLMNLLTSAWLAVLGTAGYFTLNGLVQMP